MRPFLKIVILISIITSTYPAFASSEKGSDADFDFLPALKAHVIENRGPGNPNFISRQKRSLYFKTKGHAWHTWIGSDGVLKLWNYETNNDELKGEMKASVGIQHRLNNGLRVGIEGMVKDRGPFEPMGTGANLYIAISF